jgi:predicted GIY-YIG superfamily endonuclease
MMTDRPNGTLYVGVTSDLIRRVWEHREGIIAGFTERYGLKRLVYYESLSVAALKCKFLEEECKFRTEANKFNGKKFTLALGVVIDFMTAAPPEGFAALRRSKPILISGNKCAYHAQQWRRAWDLIAQRRSDL